MEHQFDPNLVLPNAIEKLRLNNDGVGEHVVSLQYLFCLPLFRDEVFGKQHLKINIKLNRAFTKIG